MNSSLGTKKDYFLISLIGFFFGLLLMPVLINIKISFLELNFITGLVIILVFVIFANIALWLAFLIGRRLPIILQFAKFGAIGALNTLLDLGILNVLISLSGIAAGLGYSLFKTISFIAANINSYFWNRYWTFDASGEANMKEFSQFFTVSLVGLVINLAIASIVVNLIGPLGNISPERWANIGALSATFGSLVWNFVGYKFFVFKRKIAFRGVSS